MYNIPIHTTRPPADLEVDVLVVVVVAGGQGAAAADPKLLVLQVPHLAEGEERLEPLPV